MNTTNFCEKKLCVGKSCDNYTDMDSSLPEVCLLLCSVARSFTGMEIAFKRRYIQSSLEKWYENNKRILPWRETTDPYCIWVSEVILQQTRVAQGLDYYLRFTERFPDVQSLADATEDEVLRYWQGLGYYSRARNLHKAAKTVANGSGYVGGEEGRRLMETGGTASLSPAEQDAIFHNLRSMPGVGEYTAGAIASFAFNLPYPAMDGNVYRVLARLYDCDMVFDTSTGKKHFRQLAEELLDRDQSRLFNSAIMEFGALYCTPQSPDCERCPLRECCLANLHHTAELLPIRKPRPKLRDRYLNYTIYLTQDNRTLLHQRSGDDIWKHLYEFPLVETDRLLPVDEMTHSVDLLHVLSHQRLHARFHIERVAELPKIEETIAVPLSATDDYALSRLTLRAMERLLSHDC